MNRVISTRVMIVLALVYALLIVTLSLLSFDLYSNAYVVAVALGVFIAAAVTLLLPYRRGFPTISAVLGAASVVVITVLVTSQLPTDVWPGYAAWQPSAAALLTVTLSLRGRIRWAVIACASFALINTAWAMTTTVGFAGGLIMLIAPVGWLPVSYGVAHLLRGNDQKIQAYTSDAHDAAEWYASEQTLEEARNRWIDHVENVSGAVLQRIADVEHLITDDDRREFLLIEAQFRDEIRGRVLATEEVMAAARRARERGVTVELLDDRRQNLDDRLSATISESLIAVLNDARTGRVVARATPRGTNNAATIFSAATELSRESTFVEIPEPDPAPEQPQ